LDGGFGVTAEIGVFAGFPEFVLRVLQSHGRFPDIRMMLNGLIREMEMGLIVVPYIDGKVDLISFRQYRQHQHTGHTSRHSDFLQIHKTLLDRNG
jgi:hypothetical protein